MHLRSLEDTREPLELKLSFLSAIYLGPREKL